MRPWLSPLPENIPILAPITENSGSGPGQLQY